jgi:ketosteroid isomerase-like protein
MYHALVRRRLRASFDALNAGDYDAITAQFAARHAHRFPGDHPLGGERTSLDSTRLWYARLQRLFPDLCFSVKRITVAGWPWDTQAWVEWSDSFTLPDGSRGDNQGVHRLRLRWGRVTELTVYCDTARLAAFCRRAADLGRPEGALPPIDDRADDAGGATVTRAADAGQFFLTARLRWIPIESWGACIQPTSKTR